MTDQKALKKLVRARMARTGERYTTAHRHVTRRTARSDLTGLAPDAVRGLTPGYPAFGAEAHGPSALTRHLLDQAGLPLSEPLVCGLGGGIGFLYAVFEYDAVDHPLLTIVAQHHPQPWWEAVAEHLGVTLDQTTGGPRTALRRLDGALDDGRAALLTVGRGALPWHTVGTPAEAADPYPIVVAGRGAGGYIVDDAVAEPRTIAPDDLVAAWAAHRKGRFAMTTVPQLGERAAGPGPAPVDLGAGLRAALRTTVGHLTGPVIGHAFDTNMGLSGMGRLAADLADARTKRGWARRFATPQGYEHAMRRLAECLTWAHTAPGATRPLYAQFLRAAGPVAGLDLHAAADAADRAGQWWSEVADVAGASATTPTSDVAATFDLLHGLVVEALTEETALVEHLRTALA